MLFTIIIKGLPILNQSFIHHFIERPFLFFTLPIKFYLKLHTC